MNFYIGQTLEWHPYSQFESVEIVTVTGLRKRGHAMLSNGWVVNEDGVAEGTAMKPGGSVREVSTE
jgi:hypothetical protein